MDRAVTDPNIPDRDKILLRMRTEANGDRRNIQYGCSAYTPCQVRFLQNWLKYHEYWEVATCSLNTMTALYILDDRQRFPYIDAMDIETWFWRQWFRPYTTDIELSQSFVHIFAPKYEASSMKGLDIGSDGLISRHCDVCEQSERFKEAVCARKSPNSPPSMSDQLRGLPWPYSNEKVSVVGIHTFSLSSVLFMVLVYPKEQLPWTKDIRCVAEAQVQLILMGITDGLSTPICFDEIREYSTGDSYTPRSQTITTTLDMATGFILRLEQREIAAFGVRLNVCSLSPTGSYVLEHQEEAKELGWVQERDGSLDDLSLRSSEWADRTLFLRWFGRGALGTMRYKLDLIQGK